MAEVEGDPFGLVGGKLENKYEVSQVVAEGGFGVVYRAVHLGLQKTVALKVLKMPPELKGPTQVAYLEKFAQEARLIASLEHPAIVRVIDFGASPLLNGMATPWMALEWLEGRTLENQLESQQGAGADPQQVFGWMERVIDAIGLAHDEGIVHRDLKPANLMLVANKRGEIALKVLDFGIAKAVSADENVAGSSGATKTSSALVAFSPHYAAPEQLTAMRTGPATDVHAIALILVEMLCGQPAYRGSDLSEIYACALAPVRPTPGAQGVDVGAWEPVLARALAFKPLERFANAHEFLDALRASLPGARRTLKGPPRPQVIGAAPIASTLQGAAVAAPSQARRPSRGVVVGAGVALAVAAIAAVGLATRDNAATSARPVSAVTEARRSSNNVETSQLAPPPPPPPAAPPVVVAPVAPPPQAPPVAEPLAAAQVLGNAPNALADAGGGGLAEPRSPGPRERASSRRRRSSSGQGVSAAQSASAVPVE